MTATFSENVTDLVDTGEAGGLSAGTAIPNIIPKKGGGRLLVDFISTSDNNSYV